VVVGWGCGRCAAGSETWAWDPLPLVLVGLWVCPRASRPLCALSPSMRMTEPGSTAALMNACKDRLDAFGMTFRQDRPNRLGDNTPAAVQTSTLPLAPLQRRPGRHQRACTALTAQPVATCCVSTGDALAPLELNPVRPPQPLEVVQAGSLVGEPRRHLRQVPRVVPTTHRRRKSHKPTPLPLAGDAPYGVWLEN